MHRCQRVGLADRVLIGCAPPSQAVAAIAERLSRPFGYDPSRKNILCPSPGRSIRLPPDGGAMLRLLRAPFRPARGCTRSRARLRRRLAGAPAGASFTFAMPCTSKRSSMHSENEQSGMVPACSRFESGLVRVGNQRVKVLGRAASCFVLGLAHRAASRPGHPVTPTRKRPYCAPRRGRSIPSPVRRRRYAETPAGALSGRSRGCTRSRAPAVPSPCWRSCGCIFIDELRFAALMGRLFV